MQRVSAPSFKANEDIKAQTPLLFAEKTSLMSALEGIL